MSQATASVYECAVPEYSVYVAAAVVATSLGAVRMRGSVVTTSYPSSLSAVTAAVTTSSCPRSG